MIEYEIPDRKGNGKHEIIRLITSILDPHDIPAIELAAAYHERWEYENLLDEIKTHQRGPARLLRSKLPDMVKQEIWALLLTHYGIRHLMCRAADEADADPDRLSFMRSLRVIRRQVTNQADSVATLGYASEFSFAAAFKRHHGSPPGRWRNTGLAASQPAGTSAEPGALDGDFTV